MSISQGRHARVLPTISHRARVSAGVGLLSLMAGVGFVSATGAAAASGNVSVAPASIPSDCSTDVTAQLTAWAAQQPDGTTLQLQPGGCYEMDSHLVMTNRNNMIMDGNGATIEAKTTPSSSAGMLQLVGGSNLTVENLTLIGTNPKAQYNSNQEWSAGIKVGGVAGVTINNVTIKHVYGDFVTLNSNGKTPSTNVTIENSSFDTAGRQGIAFVDANGVEVNNVTLGNTGADTFDLESNSSPQGDSNITIENTTSFGSGAIWFSAGGNAVSNTGNVLVRNNTMTTTQAGDVINMWAPSGYMKSGFTFTGNTLNAGASKSVSALQLTRSSNVKFDNNVINFANAGMSSKYTHESVAYLYDCSNIETSGNTFNGPGTPLFKSTNSTGTSSNNTVNS